MEHSTGQIVKTLFIGSAACVFALGAANAYANDDLRSVDEPQIRIHEKTAVSEGPVVIRVSEPFPTLIVPLNTDYESTDVDSRPLSLTVAFNVETDLRNFDLIEESPVFLGAKKDPEFDTLNARRTQAAYSKSLNVDPLIPVAGAGLVTTF